MPAEAPKTPFYRPDIDGLRAVAVLIVVLFHADITYLSGGFVGVDVFFVISGYLITHLIKREYERDNSFSFSKFYARRARRLFPALFFTFVVSLVAAIFIFSPMHLGRFGASVIHAIFSVSNFFFWTESGYFDAGSDVKPLLHTWSLSVEEQFYLIWPAVLLLMLRYSGRSGPLILIILASFASLILNAIFADGVLIFEELSPNISELFSNGPATIFFLTPFRVFEFGFGAGLVWLEQKQPRNRLWSELLIPVGLLMIIVPAVVFTENTLFPYYNALWPCAGAAIIIYAGTRARFTVIALNNKVMVFVGLISYSLYLVHWPLFVFYEYEKNAEMVASEQATLIALAILAAAFMYRFVERPFRKPPGAVNALSPSAFGLSCMFAASFMVLGASHIWARGGFNVGLPEAVSEAVSDNAYQRRRTLHARSQLSLEDGRFHDDRKHNVLLIGDSMTADMGVTLTRLGMRGGTVRDESNRDVFRYIELEGLNNNHRCGFFLGNRAELDEYPYNNNEAEKCDRSVEKILNDPLLKSADSIIVWQLWYEWQPQNGIIEALTELRKRSEAPVYVIGRKAMFEPSVSRLLMQHGRFEGFDEFLYEERSAPRINERLQRAAEAAGVSYVAPEPLQCDLDSEACYGASGNKLLYWDNVHWTVRGSTFFGQRMREMPQWREMLLLDRGRP